MILRWHMILLTLAGIGLANRAEAQAKSLSQVTDSTVERTITVGTDKIIQKRTTQLVAQLTPGKDGTFTYKIDKVVVSVEAGGKKIFSYDSSMPEDKSDAAAVAFFKPLVKLELTVKVAPDGNVTVANAQKLREIGSKHTKEVLGLFISDKIVPELITGGISQFPSSAKDAKAEWTTTKELDLAHLGKFTIKSTMNNKEPGKDGKADKVEVNYDVSYAAPTTAADAPTAKIFLIKKGELKSSKEKGKAGGEFFYNKKTNWIDSSNLTLDMSGSLTIEIAGTTVEATIAVKHLIVSKVTEKP